MSLVGIVELQKLRALTRMRKEDQKKKESTNVRYECFQGTVADLEGSSKSESALYHRAYLTRDDAAFNGKWSMILELSF